MKMYTNCKTREEGHKTPNQLGVACSSSSEVNYQLKKLVLNSVNIFIVLFPGWAGIKIDSGPNRKWNQNQFQPKQEKEV